MKHPFLLSVFVCFLSFLYLVEFVNSHNHDHHDHEHEDHRHWYTKESNEKLQESLKAEKDLNRKDDNSIPHSSNGHKEGKHDDRHTHGDEEDGDHGHSGHGNGGHGHSHDHGHSEHGHSHGHGQSGHVQSGHGHSHGHGQSGHGHSHGHGQSGHGHSHGHGQSGHSGHVQEETGQHKKTDGEFPTSSKYSQPIHYIWFESLLSTALISAAPFLILFFVPLENNSAEQRPLLKVLLSFASGGLLGDAFLHLIPHAISPHSHHMDGSGTHTHSHSHSHNHEGESPEASHDHSANMIVGLWVLAGMVAFLIVEKFVRHVKGGHFHSHSHGPSMDQKKSDVAKVVHQEKEEQDSEVRKRKKETSNQAVDETNVVHENETDAKGDGSIEVSGYLNLAADFTHNFTDGLAIGASYIVSRNVGLITTLTILLHEVPHEIGDFAILVQSGCTKRKAMLLQLSTATGALAGTLCGLLAENIGNTAASGILPFTAGGFIYIATVSVIPELLEDANIKQSFKEILALSVGVLLMVLIAMIE